MTEFFTEAFESSKDFLIDAYTSYKDAIYGVFPGQSGDLILFLINTAIIIGIVVTISFTAFKNK